MLSYGGRVDRVRVQNSGGGDKVCNGNGFGDQVRKNATLQKKTKKKFNKKHGYRLNESRWAVGGEKGVPHGKTTLKILRQRLLSASRDFISY